jgi:hypothetical protein
VVQISAVLSAACCFAYHQCGGTTTGFLETQWLQHFHKNNTNEIDFEAWKFENLTDELLARVSSLNLTLSEYIHSQNRTVSASFSVVASSIFAWANASLISLFETIHATVSIFVWWCMQFWDPDSSNSESEVIRSLGAFPTSRSVPTHEIIVQDVCVALFSSHHSNPLARSLPHVVVLWLTGILIVVLNFLLERVAYHRYVFSEYPDREKERFFLSSGSSATSFPPLSSSGTLFKYLIFIKTQT